MVKPCAGECGQLVTFLGMYCKYCANRLGVSCDPEGKKKAANAKSNPINNPINNSRRAAARPALAKSDAELGLAKIVRHSPEYLRTVVAIALRRPDIKLLWAAGSQRRHACA